MRVVVALGGNALLRRGEPLTAENQRANARAACKALAPLALEHELVISHGNGPQVGLLALQGSAYKEVEPYPLDLLGAQTEGMIGYLIQQELGNELPFEKRLASLLTLIEVDPRRPRVRGPDEADRPDLHRGRGRRGSPRRRAGTFKPDGDSFRRVVPSPLPQRIFGIEPVEWLLEHGASSSAPAAAASRSCTPTSRRRPGRQLVGVEAVIDKDLASALLARDLRRRRAADRHRRRRRLRGLGHAGAARDPSGDPGGARASRSSRRVDGAEGARRLLVRRADRAASPRSARSTTRRRCSAARPARPSRSTRPGSRSRRRTDRTTEGDREMATAEKAPGASNGLGEAGRLHGTRSRPTRSSAASASTRRAASRPPKPRRGSPRSARTSSRRPRSSRAGARSCASTATRCRSSCSSRGSAASTR